MENMFIQVDEVCEILGVSRSKAYQLMRQLNAELEKKGRITIHIDDEDATDDCKIVNIDDYLVS